MSINIVQINEHTVLARTVCDECKAIIDERPSHPGEFPGTTQMVCNWCEECAPKHRFPLNVPWHTVLGEPIGNPSCVARVTIKTNNKPEEEQ